MLLNFPSQTSTSSNYPSNGFGFCGFPMGKLLDVTWWSDQAIFDQVKEWVS